MLLAFSNEGTGKKEQGRRREKEQEKKAGVIKENEEGRWREKERVEGKGDREERKKQKKRELRSNLLLSFILYSISDLMSFLVLFSFSVCHFMETSYNDTSYYT